MSRFARTKRKEPCAYVRTGQPSVASPQRCAVCHHLDGDLMGASNALAAFRRWSGKVPGTSMLLLTYMALISKDKDEWPWYGQGQEALAEFALGRENPNGTDVRAVSRAMQPLLDAGAVSVERAATNRGDGNSTARYRLNITENADRARQKWEESHDGKRRMADPRRKGSPYDEKRRVDGPVDNLPQDQIHTTVSGRAIRRKVTSHTTVSDEPYDGNRRAKEEEDQEERENRGIGVEETATSHRSRASAERISTPNLCPIHKIPLKPRDDGDQACGFCRRERRAGPPRPGPPPPPPPTARVIDLDSRRIA